MMRILTILSVENGYILSAGDSFSGSVGKQWVFSDAEDLSGWIRENIDDVKAGKL